jgi:hypothetical protein
MRLRATGNDPYDRRGRVRDAEICKIFEELSLLPGVIAFIKAIHTDQQARSIIQQMPADERFDNEFSYCACSDF